MRLLHTETLALCEFFEEHIPAYAILSHTWGADEITCQELQTWLASSDVGDYKAAAAIAKKSGFLKVKEAAAFAAARGFTYTWVDTCCIDKSSSAELLEAINSMYQWYANSAECHALLTDVPCSLEQNIYDEASAFRRSRWFTRGWTLQELIAPNEVIFLAKDWTIFGTKTSSPALVDLIHQITGVPVAVLSGEIRPWNLSVASRLQWASARQTTRPEDIAYCLLGIFDVNMPLLYGEGYKAFIRLQEAILKSTSDQSLFAWNRVSDVPDDPDGVCGLFARSPSEFLHCGGIETLPISSVTESIPIEMTSHGLRVQFYLRPLWSENAVSGNEDFYAMLDCVVRIGDRDYCPAIWLRRLGRDQFGRLHPSSRKLLPPVSQNVPTYIEGYQPIFVRDIPTYYGLPTFRPINQEVSTTDLDVMNSTFRLEEAFPKARWNPSTMTMRSTFSRRTELTGVFRFSNSSGYRIDVAFGLTKGRGLVWQAWCAQRRCRGEKLASAFELIEADIRDKMSANKVLPAFWYTMQNLIGEDDRLPSDARVNNMKLHGRSYISVSIVSKVEICTHKELESMPKMPDGMLKTSAGSSTSIRYAKILTTRYTVASTKLSSSIEAVLPYGIRRHLELSLPYVYTEIPLLGFLELHSDEPTIQSIEAPSSIGSDSKSNADPKLLVMHMAAAKGDSKLIQHLFNTKPQTTFADQAKDGWTALHIAAAMGHVAVIECILSHPQSNIEQLINLRTTTLLETPLHLLAGYAPQGRQLSCFQMLCNIVPSTTSIGMAARNALDETPLHRAAVSDNPHLIRAIIDETDRRNTSYNRNPDIIGLIDVNIYRPEFVRQVDYGDRWGRSPLWHAAATGSCSAITTLHELGARIDLADDYGLTPLHAAAREGHSDAVQTLLLIQANPRVDTPVLGLTPLHLAVLFGYRDCVDELLSFKHDVNMGSETKPIHLAVASGHFDITKKLLEHSAWINIGCDECLKLNTEEDCSKVIAGGDSAEQLAEQNGHDEILTYIRSCKPNATATSLPSFEPGHYSANQELNYNPSNAYLQTDNYQQSFGILPQQNQITPEPSSQSSQQSHNFQQIQQLQTPNEQYGGTFRPLPFYPAPSTQTPVTYPYHGNDQFHQPASFTDPQYLPYQPNSGYQDRRLYPSNMTPGGIAQHSLVRLHSLNTGNQIPSGFSGLTLTAPNDMQSFVEPAKIRLISEVNSSRQQIEPTNSSQAASRSVRAQVNKHEASSTINFENEKHSGAFLFDKYSGEPIFELPDTPATVRALPASKSISKQKAVAYSSEHLPMHMYPDVNLWEDTQVPESEEDIVGKDQVIRGPWDRLMKRLRS